MRKRTIKFEIKIDKTRAVLSVTVGRILPTKASTRLEFLKEVGLVGHTIIPETL